MYIDWVNEKIAEDPQMTFELLYVNEDKIPEIAAIGKIWQLERHWELFQMMKYLK